VVTSAAMEETVISNTQYYIGPCPVFKTASELPSSVNRVYEIKLSN